MSLLMGGTIKKSRSRFYYFDLKEGQYLFYAAVNKNL